ncbi:DUF6114 domain-containing protein [Dactylosporangium sp. CA-092794]|uniref:DUF6114 domain-containing protein n=1 Tax=Dactylosporangium sp. CA-092794 TaxID=3239929 RepID=UPI003D90FE0E
MITSHASVGWRAQRPFWGGLLLMLSSLELFLSGNMKLALEVHFGPTGFLSYVIPLIMLLCGVLTWFTPQQRLFYGILGTVTALYSLIGLNLGGFFLGMLLGLAGGGLAVAWAPVVPPDVLASEPISEDAEPVLEEGDGAGSADDQLPPASGPGDLPRRRHLGPLLMLAALAVSILAATDHPGTAYAAPCKPPSLSPSAAASSPRSSSASPSPSPSASPSPSPTQDNPTGILGWLSGLFGGGKQAAAATPSPSLSPPAPASSAAPATRPASPRPTACPSATPNNKQARVPAGQPFVAKQPSILRAKVMTMDSLTYDGVAELPHRDGTKVRVLAFSMKNSVSTPFELDTPGAPKQLITTSSKLTVSGNVKFYTTSFSANVLGLLPLTFTPSFPPPPIPLPGFYTNCTIELVYVQSNLLTAPALSITYAA